MNIALSVFRRSTVLFAGWRGGAGRGMWRGRGHPPLQLQLHVLGLVLWKVRHGALGGGVPAALLLLLESLLRGVPLDVLWKRSTVRVTPTETSSSSLSHSAGGHHTVQMMWFCPFKVSSSEMTTRKKYLRFLRKRSHIPHVWVSLIRTKVH